MHTRIAIVGSGFAGLGMAIRLRQQGDHDFLVFERAAEVGGVWRDNSYPGCACDVESHLYSFSFARNPNWSRAFSPQPEILAYLRDCAERFGITPHLRLGHTITAARWDGMLWHLATTQGAFTADMLVVACGALSEPAIPHLPGIETFRGATFHSARWNHELDLAGKRVAVIGTGASAIQFVPAIQPQVASLALFQRTAPWVLPRRDHALSETKRRRLRSSRLAQLALRGRIYAQRETFALAFLHPRISRLAQRGALRYLARKITDPVLRAKLTPPYALGCKRVLISDDYLPAVAQPNVTVETSGVAEVTEDAVIARDGTRYPVDAIIYGTGFQVQDYPFAHLVRGRDGRTLHETWNGAMTAHLGTTVHNFPNLFLMMGPNTGLGHSSVILMIESQIQHVLNALAYMKAHDVTTLEPRAEAQAAFVADVQARTKGTVWTSGGCESWYLDANGRNSALWPSYTFSFAKRVEPFDPREYTLTTRVRPTLRLVDRIKARAGRLLPTLPERVVRRLAGKPIVLDGQTLAPDMQLLLKMMDKAQGLLAPTASELRKNQALATVLGAGAPVPVRAVRDLDVDGLRARHYAPEQNNGPLVVFLHGGGFVFGDLETHDRLCRMLCLHASVNVLAIEYRLAPEHPFPAGNDDAERAWRWALAHAAELGADPARIAIAGDSAGGNLATLVAQKFAGTADAPVAQLLIYPTVDHPGAYPSKELFAKDFFLTSEVIAWFHAQYIEVTSVDTTDPRLRPLTASSLAHQPPAIIVTAGFDPLRDEAEAYGVALQQAGSTAIVRRFPGLLHGFANMTGVSRSSADAIVETAGMLRSVLSVPEPREQLRPHLAVVG